MFKKTDYILIPHSASAAYHNLSTKSKYKKSREAVAVFHHDTVCVVPIKSSTSSNKTKQIRCSKYTNEKNINVTQVEWCNLGFENVLLITSTVGLQVFDQNGEECIFSHPCNDSNEGHSQTFARGIAVFNCFYFCIGNSTGCIRMFGPPNLEDEITFIDRKHNHHVAIAHLSAHKDYLASADEDGYIMLWRLESDELVHKITVVSRSECTGIILKRDWFITTYVSGHIRLYSINKEVSIFIHLSIEVAAHARMITGLDISDNNEYLLSVSEDSYAKIWQIYKDGNFLMLKHMHNILLKDNMLVGGKFLTANGSKFCVSTYDSNIVSCFSL